MNRRRFISVAALGGMATFNQCSGTETSARTPCVTTRPLKRIRPKTKPRVVVVGGGFGGLNTASAIKQNDPENAIEVIVVERNNSYFACPMSNTLLSGDKRFSRDMFIFNYVNVQLEFDYEVMQAEVTDIDRAQKLVCTSQGFLEYDFLVLAPGIEYNYKDEFPHWPPEKIRRARLEAPGGLISDVGVEHSVLLEQLERFKRDGGEGVIAIIPPRLKFTHALEKSVPHKSVHRCKPAAYERACMIGNWVKNNNLVGKAKVLVLDNSARPLAKPAAFEQVFEELYSGIIEYRGGFDLMDVDFDKKEILHRGINDDADYIEERLKYDLLNLIPVQKASSLIRRAGLKTNSWGGAVLAERNFYSVTDKSVYVIGDSAFYGKGVFEGNPKKKGGVPAAAQTAYSSAVEAGRMISERLLKHVDKPVETFSASCFSMVQSDNKAQLGIAIYKDFYFSDKGMTIGETIPKIGGKFYNEEAGQGLPGWFSAVTGATFARF